MLIYILVLMGGCAYGPPTLRVTIPDHYDELIFPERNLEKIAQSSIGGVALYPQIIVQSHASEEVTACVRAYYSGQEPVIEISSLVLTGANGIAISGVQTNREETLHKTHPEGLLNFKVICKRSYSWSQIKEGNIAMSFSASINGSRDRSYAFEMEAGYVRYSAW
ncbi:hypothetical protein MWU49_04395 [Alcanivorax sp. S6407]|uniref:hypothetical protein n=1 Tax=Alcanivorax sp. S6407 TaxID=2926424 RepID=UPI001FF6F063|nr:hypothetical protein [Alcanivorax sp. S6407]MCK0152931.1 hypothetical protein [Alcanivorax sp. S6407]